MEKKPVKRKNIYVKFVQKNKESLEFIKNHLEKEKIETGEIYSNQNAWVLKIKIISIPSFSSYIKSLHPKKRKRLDLLTKALDITVCAQG